jgi:hypothetical protein
METEVYLEVKNSKLQKFKSQAIPRTKTLSRDPASTATAAELLPAPTDLLPPRDAYNGVRCHPLWSSLRSRHELNIHSVGELAGRMAFTRSSRNALPMVKLLRTYNARLLRSVGTRNELTAIQTCDDVRSLLTKALDCFQSELRLTDPACLMTTTSLQR